MCESMGDIQSPAAEIRRGKKIEEDRRRRKKLQGKNIMVCPITEGDHKKKEELEMWANAQRDGRPVEYRWRPLFNAAV